MWRREGGREGVREGGGGAGWIHVVVGCDL